MSTAVAQAHASTPLPVGRLMSVGAVIFVANAALLVLQLVAGRLLAPFIGSSLETWTSIIGVFLTGIALGNAYGGKLADRYPSPKTLATLLAIGAVAALWMLLFPTVLSWTGAHKVLPLGPRIPILAAALCLPAGFVLSLLTPLAIKLGLPDVGHTGRVAGLIFALSTLGCLLGNYLTGFYLIPAFTINTLVLVSVGVLAALAAVSLLMVQPTQNPPSQPPSLQSDGQGGQASTPSAPGGGQAASSSQNPFAFADIRHAYMVVFLGSFCGMTLELTASRVLAQQLGVSLFTWTGVIGVMLAGTATGNFFGGQIADRARHALAALAGFGTFLAACVLALFISLIVFATETDQRTVEYSLGIPANQWDAYVPRLRQAAQQDELTAMHLSQQISNEIRTYHQEELPGQLPALRRTLGVGLVLGGLLGAALGYLVFRLLNRPSLPALNPRYVLAATLCSAGAATVLLFVTMAIVQSNNLFETWDPIPQVMIWTFTLFFLPMFGLGLVSPQVIRLAVPDMARVGEVAGRVYAWSTAGAIVGTFAAGYVLLSSAGMFRTLLGAALVLTLTSLLIARVWENNPLLYLFSIVLGGVAGGFILTSREREDTIAQVESNYYTIKVTPSGTRARPNLRSLNLDRLLHSVVDPDDPRFLYYEHEYIQMEFLQVARTETGSPRCLVIGGGGYTFPRYVMETMPDARMDVVEIDPKVTQVAKDHLGLKPYHNLRIYHMDGRQFVAERADRGSYDLVVQDAVNDLSVPGHLMTKEYNDAVKAVLKPNGVYLLTIIDSLAGGKLWKAAMATLEKTFPNVSLLIPERIPMSGTPEGEAWDRARHVMVIYASDRPLDLDTLREVSFGTDMPEFKLRVAAVAVAAGAAGTPPPPWEGQLPGLPVARFTPVSYAHQVWPERLKKYTDREPGIVLTDQYAPVDNLMADVFRNRNR